MSFSTQICAFSKERYYFKYFKGEPSLYRVNQWAKIYKFPVPFFVCRVFDSQFLQVWKCHGYTVEDWTILHEEEMFEQSNSDAEIFRLRLS